MPLNGKVLLLAGAGAVALMAMGGKNAGAASGGASGVAGYTGVINGLRNNHPEKLIAAIPANWDDGTKNALAQYALRMKLRNAGKPVPAHPTLVQDGKTDLQNNEWSAALMALEGSPAKLNVWAAAYQPIYPLIAQALRLKSEQISKVTGGDEVDVIQKMVADAIATGDPNVMMHVADEIQRRGNKTVADELRAIARDLQRPPPAKPGTPPKAPSPLPLPITPPSAQPAPGSGVITVPPPRVTLPPIQTPAGPLPQPAPAPIVVDPGYKRAQDLAIHLWGGITPEKGGKFGRPRGKEDTTMVKLFQTSEQGMAGDADGKYGIKAASLMAVKYNIIPPLPRYFSKKTWQTDKKNYKTLLATKAAEDPDRAALWLEAAKVDAL